MRDCINTKTFINIKAQTDHQVPLMIFSDFPLFLGQKPTPLTGSHLTLSTFLSCLRKPGLFCSSETSCCSSLWPSANVGLSFICSGFAFFLKSRFGGGKAF